MATSNDIKSGFASLGCPLAEDLGTPLSSSFISLSVAFAIDTNIPGYRAIIGRLEWSIAIVVEMIEIGSSSESSSSDEEDVVVKRRTALQAARNKMKTNVFNDDSSDDGSDSEYELK